MYSATRNKPVAKLAVTKGEWNLASEVISQIVMLEKQLEIRQLAFTASGKEWLN